MQTREEDGVEVLRVDDACDVFAERKDEEDGALALLPLRGAIQLGVTVRMMRNGFDAGDDLGPLTRLHLEAGNRGNHPADCSPDEDVLFLLQKHECGRFHYPLCERNAHHGYSSIRCRTPYKTAESFACRRGRRADEPSAQRRS